MNKEITITGKKIHYRVFGNGNPVMLVHGFGETGDVWRNQVDFFKDKFRLIIPDLPGSGKSDLIDDMSMEGMAEVIKSIADGENLLPESSQVPLRADAGNRQPKPISSDEVLSQASGDLGGKGLILIGHSMGGYITLAFAEKYSHFLKAFGLFHSSAYADSEEKKAARRKGIEFIREHGAFGFLKNATPNLFSPASRSENQALIEDFIQSLNNFSAESLVSYYEAMMERPARTAILTKTKIPVLFIMGEYDTAVPLEDGLKLCSLPELSYIHILRKSGHMGMIEEADFSNEMLAKFFEEARLF
jgi:pimeloyl-ACP methyl ester carboxylesterase